MIGVKEAIISLSVSSGMQEMPFIFEHWLSFE
jgi:hypothetical protein